ncbi:MAG TPA: cytosine deaminase, partial [Allocoleopsis sp.]
MIPSSENYWIKNAQVPACLIVSTDLKPTHQGLCWVDLEIARGAIAQIVPAGSSATGDTPTVDWHKGQVWPCFVDMHTHLDKGHIWDRTPNLDGTFAGAIDAAKADSEQYWQARDVYRRMEFGIKCSYAHGTKAIRTHIDSFGEQSAISLEAFKTLQQAWADRVILQPVSLVSLDYYQTPEGVTLADKIAEVSGILGGVAYMNPDLDAQLDTVFNLAQERGLNLDFHTDENGDPDSICLQKVAE